MYERLLFRVVVVYLARKTVAASTLAQVQSRARLLRPSSFLLHTQVTKVMVAATITCVPYCGENDENVPVFGLL
jgi:hypothetical protein